MADFQDILTSTDEEKLNMEKKYTSLEIKKCIIKNGQRKNFKHN